MYNEKIFISEKSKKSLIKSEKNRIFTKSKNLFVNDRTVNECERCLGYSFKNVELLKTALTHRSCSSEQKRNYERLEFLGDSVLGYIVAEHLFLEYSNKEGVLTADKQRLVSTEPLATAAKSLHLNEFVAISDNLKQNAFLHGVPDSVCENVYEAIVAAIYLDGGLSECKAFIQRSLLVNEKKSLKTKNYIVELQEYAQANKLGTPIYETVSQSGPDHDPLFTMAVVIGDKRIALGSGSTKKLADRQAAERALKKIRKGKAK